MADGDLDEPSPTGRARAVPWQAIRALVAALVRAVPGLDEDRSTAARLAREAGIDQLHGESLAWGVLAVLEAMGAIEPPREEDGEHSFRTGTETGALFLASMAEHIDAGLPMLKSWRDRSITEPPLTGTMATRAAQFLWLAENERHEALDEAPAIRRVPISLIIAKAQLGRKHVRYLMHFDAEEREYRPLGGQRLRIDNSMKAAAIRELEAHLPAFRFDPDTDKLFKLERTVVTAVPADRGVVTAHEIHFWEFQSTRTRLSLSPSVRWATGEQLLKTGALEHGYTPVVQGLRYLAGRIPGGLDGLRVGVRLSR
ncbi:hypothetical protein [Asanoa iriomotensis]|uniref:Uncharacterized protein n=1 Tax=Asanoa iriomotensis TaxID=234613 RepID=A0ABQ4CBJ9_9ACTN|nr:hypothetical protein [Asanoa iriomotensis]GIF60133.1 hypothetical protein Air01nite_62280 [Asanoa iriomotensis]